VNNVNVGPMMCKLSSLFENCDIEIERIFLSCRNMVICTSATSSETAVVGRSLQNAVGAHKS
jgi:hypothetical protein